MDFMSKKMNDIRKEESLNSLKFKMSVAEVKTAEIEQITQNTNVRLAAIEQWNSNTQTARYIILKVEKEMKRQFND